MGYNSERNVAEQIMQTADAPARIALTIDGEPLANEGKDMVQVRAAAQDERGTFYPYPKFVSLAMKAGKLGVNFRLLCRKRSRIVKGRVGILC